MKIQQNQKKSVKITEASEYLGVSINTLKTFNSERNFAGLYSLSNHC